VRKTKDPAGRETKTHEALTAADGLCERRGKKNLHSQIKSCATQHAGPATEITKLEQEIRNEKVSYNYGVHRPPSLIFDWNLNLDMAHF
jgi:hypothetical protein